MKTRIITLILTTFTLLSLTSCLSGIDTSSNNGGNGGNGNNQDQTSDYYKLEVNGSTWQIHKSKAVIKENTGENQMDYTVTLIAVDASNTITLDSKQLYINFNADDLESLEGENIALSEDFNILYRGKNDFTQKKYVYKSGVMSISKLGTDYVEISFGNLNIENKGSLIDPNEVIATLSVNGTIKCMTK